MTDDLGEMLDSLDRRASLGMALGDTSKIVIEPTELRQMVKAVRLCRERAAEMHAVSLRMKDAIKRAEWWERVLNVLAWVMAAGGMLAVLAMMVG